MPNPIHEYDSATQEHLLGRTWRRSTYPWVALVEPVASIIRGNGEVILSWADLSPFDGAERLETDAFIGAGYWLAEDAVDWLRTAHGDHVGPLHIRPPNKARGFPITRGGVVQAVAWDDARIQLNTTLEHIALEENGEEFFAEVLLTACSYLVDLFVLDATQRRLIHQAWEPHGLLAPIEYGIAGSFGYWRRCVDTFAATFLRRFTTLDLPHFTIPLGSSLPTMIEAFALPDDLMDPGDWSIHWPHA